MANLTHIEVQQRRAAAATAQSVEISMMLSNLTAMVKLAAFATEARRTLAEIDNALHFRPEIQKVVHDYVSNSAQWAVLEDNTGDVLSYVARQLEKVNDDFTENLSDLARSSKGRTEPEKIGGTD
jgi:hypothetical protein